MSYIPRMRESSAGWLGQGQIVYSTSGHANNPFADSPALQQLQQPYKDAQIKRRAAQAADKAARQAGRQGHVTVYDANPKVKKYVSATPEETALIRESNKKIQLERRAAQAADKAARKASKRGRVTVFNPSAENGPYVSASPKRAKIIEAANRQSAIGITPNLPAVIQKSQYNFEEILNSGNKLNFNNPFDIPNGTSGTNLTSAGAGVSGAGAGSASGAATTANTSAIVNNAQNGTTKTGFLSKIKNGFSNLFSKAKNALSGGLSKAKAFVKTPKGKWSLAIAAVVLVGTALCAYVANRFSDKNKPTPTNGPDKIFMPKLEEKSAAVEDDEDVDDTDDSEKTDKADKANEAKAAAEAEKKEADKAAKANQDKREPEKVSGDEYEVVEGDCVWNIAKAHLKELNSDIDDYTPTNVDILRHTKELMEINDLHYEADNYVVIIQPGQKIKLKKSE